MFRWGSPAQMSQLMLEGANSLVAGIENSDPVVLTPLFVWSKFIL